MYFRSAFKMFYTQTNSLAFLSITLPIGYLILRMGSTVVFTHLADDFIQRMYTFYLLFSLGIKPITLALVARALLFHLQEGISQNNHKISYFTSLTAYQRGGESSTKEACNIQLQLVQIFKVINATNVL